MFKVLAKIYGALFGYSVRVIGGEFNGMCHKARSYSEALEWARCYAPHHRRRVAIFDARGRLVGRIA